MNKPYTQLLKCYQKSLLPMPLSVNAVNTNLKVFYIIGAHWHSDKYKEYFIRHGSLRETADFFPEI